MHNLDFNNDEFDIVLMGWCLAYSNNKKKALSEVKRVLTKNGLLVIGYTVSKTLTDQDQINARGYLVRSPYNKVNSMEDLDELVRSEGFNMYYSKLINKMPVEKLVYGATK